MSDTIISVENLGKRYSLRHLRDQRYIALRDVLVEKATGLFRRSGKDRGNDATREDFWALRDISFELKEGEVLGIIGRNGAGKSTLLKILSRITDPTEGRVRIRGRIASLLEVGTGFHPELTGRENIFLNGAILGMSRVEIKKHFDTIVDFAEIGTFLDTPVKRYSSGMYVRLAFAVAAHLEPEILVVDEVLAVGDAQFQKKCLGRLEHVSKKEGRTVLFVSHNIGVIKSLCTSCIVLHKGHKILQGSVNESLSKYLSFDQTQLNNQLTFIRENIPPSSKVYLREVEMIDDQHLDYFRLKLIFKIQSRVQTRIGINIRLKDAMGFPVAYGCSHYFNPDLCLLAVGTNEISIITQRQFLATGTFKIGIELVVPGVESLDLVEDCIQFELTNDSIAKRDYGVSQSWGYGATEIKFENIT